MKENIYKKLFNLQNELGAISKDAKNPFYNSKYFDINSLIAQLKPLLAKYNLYLEQPIMNNEVHSIIWDIDTMERTTPSFILLPDNLDAQKLGSAITYFRRYTLVSLLALQAVDDDGNLAIKTLPPLLADTPQMKNAEEGMAKGKTIYDIKQIYTVSSEIEKKLLNFKI